MTRAGHVARAVFVLTMTVLFALLLVHELAGG